MSSNYSASSPEARYARAVLTQNLKLRPGERVLIEGWNRVLPWAVAFSREARRLKAFPLILYEDEGAYWDTIEAKGEGLVGTMPSHEAAALGRTSVFVHFWGEVVRPRMEGLPAERRDRILGFNADWYRLAAKAGVRGARLDIGRVDPELARRYRVDLDEWKAQEIAGTMIDPDVLRRSAAPVAKALARGKRLRIRDDHGTDLTLGLKHRAPRIASGRLFPEDLTSPFTRLLTLPAGSVRVAVDETVAEGTIVANRSSYTNTERATGGSFEFRNGRLTHFEFAKGGESFVRDFKKAGKGKDRPGYFGVGLNPGLHDTPQLEDVEAGAILVSVGGNQFFGGSNPVPFFVAQVNVGAEVEVDGRSIPIPRGRAD
jgi:leucyl aminopeptidase (aminopeptidase T)